MHYIHLFVTCFLAFRGGDAQSCDSIPWSACPDCNFYFDLCEATEGCVWDSNDEFCNSPDGLGSSWCCLDDIQPTVEPTDVPTTSPSVEPTAGPSIEPTTSPSSEPTDGPTTEPSAEPSDGPTTSPSVQPTIRPSTDPTTSPSSEPTYHPTAVPSIDPTSSPSIEPTDGPTTVPSTEPSDGPTATPSVEPSTVPSFEPSSSPTREPTDIPSQNPTSSPTRGPSDMPSMNPSEGPTARPSFDPTLSPSRDPTTFPTANPSSSPTTPAPTHPGELTCGSHTVGLYTGVPIHVEVRMPYDGDMTVDLSASNFEIDWIAAYDSNGIQLADADPSSSTLTVHDLTHAADYSVVFEGATGVSSGTFDIVISCSSDAPTRSPTTVPSNDPTSSPTRGPSSIPSLTPTSTPTRGPTDLPSLNPSLSPTPSPVNTPWPTPRRGCSDSEEEERYSDQMPRRQCTVQDSKCRYSNDHADRPMFDGSGYAGYYTLADCMRRCDTDTDSKGRPCVAVEWTDHGDTLSERTKRPCYLAWGCDDTEYSASTSVYKKQDDSNGGHHSHDSSSRHSRSSSRRDRRSDVMLFGHDGSASFDGQWFQGDDHVDTKKVVETGSVVVLHAKGMAIIGLLFVAIVLMILCCGMRSRGGHKYEAVIMDTDSEMDNLRV